MQKKRVHKKYLRDVGKTCKRCGKIYFVYLTDLCGSCYSRDRRNRMPPSECHPERPAWTLKSMLCERCHAKQRRRKPRTQEQKEKVTREARLRPYKMSQADYDALFLSQKGLCAICKTDPAEAIDHCHTSNKLRELLCHRCNRGLGHFDDNPILVAQACMYLLKHHPVGGL